MIAPEQRQMALNLIEEAHAAGARLVLACKELKISDRTYRRWKKSITDQRTLRKNPEIADLRRLSDEEKDKIIETCNQDRFASLPPTQIVPILADEGVYLASESSFYRVLKEYGLNARRGRTQKRNKPSKPKEIKVNGPGQCLTWDITYLPTLVAGLYFKLYLILDLFSRKIVGWEVHERESSELASELIYKTKLKENLDTKNLIIHSDNGAPMKGSTIKALYESLGITSSYSRPSVSNDNPFSESLFKTLKYCPKYPSKSFESLKSARHWVHEFVQWYNSEHRHSGLKFVTPNERHTGQDKKIFVERDGVYKQAKINNPLRWSGQTRNWQLNTEVVLNPEKMEAEIRKKTA